MLDFGDPYVSIFLNLLDLAFEPSSGLAFDLQHPMIKKCSQNKYYFKINESLNHIMVHEKNISNLDKVTDIT